MATYYVNTSTGSNGNSGTSSGAAWATLNHAHDHIAPNDTVKIAPGVYYEELIITVAGSTWEHDGTAGVVYIDGKYDPAEAWSVSNTHILAPNNAAGRGWLRDQWNTIYNALVQIKASDVTVDGKTKWGIVVRNVCGEGFSLEKGHSNITVKYVRVDFTYTGNWRLHSDSSLVEHCCSTRSGMMYWDPDRTTYLGANVGPGAVPSAVLTLDGSGMTVRDMLCTASYGEGIVAGKRSTYVTIEDCEVHDTLHVGIYVNYSRNSVVRRNLVWAHPTGFDDKSGDGIGFGDETSGDSPQYIAQYGLRNVKIYNNVVVNAARCLILRGNPPKEGGNYQTVIDGAYVGYNTIIANDKSLVTKSAVDMGIAHPPGIMLVENNIFDVAPGSNITPVVWQATGSSVGIRRNMWRAQPIAAARGENDIYGVTGITSPGVTPPAINYDRTAASFTPVSWRSTITAHHLLSSSAAIGKAFSGGYKNNTPPAFTTDFDGATRSAIYDLGAHEFDGTPTDPGDTLTAGFSQSATEGQPPLTVNFTDTSSSSGTITSRSWDFGDGTTSAATNPSKVYNAPGVYMPTLTVVDDNGLSDIAVGDAITVTAAGGGSTSAFDIVRVAVATSTGNMTPTALALGGRVPVALLFVLSNVTAVGTPADGGLMSVGAWAAGQGYAQAIFTKDAAATGVTARLAADGAVAVSLTEAGITGSVAVASVGADSVTLNVTDAFPAAYQLTIVAFTGAEAEASIAKVRPGAANSTFAGPGGDAVLAYSAWSNTADTAAGAELSFGAAGGSNQASALWNDKHGEDPTNVQQSISKAFILRDRTGGATKANIQATNVTSGAYKVLYNDSNHDMILLGMRLDGSISVGQIAAGTTVANQSYSVGFAPSLVLLWGGLLTTNDTQGFGNNTGSAFWIAAVTAADGTFYTGITAQDNVATSNTQGNVDSTIKVYKGGGTLDLAGAVTLDADGFDINWTTVNGSAVLINYAAFEGGSSAPTNTPIVDFVADETVIDAGATVTFTNLTNANGATITGYLWDFGDGLTSSLASPAHVYNDPGVYTVTLAVTTAGGTYYKTRSSYLTINYVPDTVVIARAAVPKTITNTTVTTLYNDLNDEENFGIAEYGLDLDGGQWQIDPTDRSVPPGYVWVYVVSGATDDLTVKGKDSDGNLYTLGTLTRD